MPAPAKCDGRSVPSRNGRVTPLVESVAGLSAGLASTLVNHPLDVIKIRMHLHRSSKTPTTLSLIRQLAAQPEPVAAFYRALTPSLVGNAAGLTLFFFFKSRAENSIAQWKTGQPWTELDARTRRRALTPVDFLAASSISGALSAVLTNPIWVVKTRMIGVGRAETREYGSTAASIRHIWRTSGLRGFYLGLGPSLMGVSHGAVQFAVYEPLKKAYLERRAGADNDRIGNQATLAMATLSKVMAGVVTYPHQVIRSRMQTQDAEGLYGRGIRGVVVRIWHEAGVRGFYKGIMPSVYRVMPATWVTFLVYENVKYYLPGVLAAG